jgi:prominin 1
VLRRGGCDPLKDPEHDQVFSYFDNFIDLNQHLFRDHHRRALHGDRKHMEALRISQVIAACHRNESIFDVLRLGNEVNIDNIRDFPKQFEIDKKLDELAENVRVSSPIKILNDEARIQLRELSQSQLNSFARYKYDDNLVLNITKYDLNEIADR